MYKSRTQVSTGHIYLLEVTSSPRLSLDELEIRFDIISPQEVVASERKQQRRRTEEKKASLG